jgi:hypothetical protein
MSLHSANARLKTSFEAAALANLLFIEYQSNQSLKLAGPWGAQEPFPVNLEVLQERKIQPCIETDR